MNPVVKEKWLAALRSGEIKKANGSLENPDGCMCAMGVLHHLYEKENGENPRDNASNFFKWAGFKDEVSLTWGPVAAPFEYLGPWGELNGTVGAVNDATGDTFDVVADVIERNL
jgi:hypothetical protein